MLKIIVPVAMGLVGLAAGVGAAVMLDPPQKSAKAVPSSHGPTEQTEFRPETTSFVKFNRQFVVPVVRDGQMEAMVVMSLTMEVLPSSEDRAFERMPRLRDSFLRVMLDHAGTGGFDGAFTENGTMDRLRARLMDAGQAELGQELIDVLILDIGRQDA